MLALANAIFELFYPDLKEQAVFTVPTYAVTTAAVPSRARAPHSRARASSANPTIKDS
jgi:hypothetical protein